MSCVRSAILSRASGTDRSGIESGSQKQRTVAHLALRRRRVAQQDRRRVMAVRVEVVLKREVKVALAERIAALATSDWRANVEANLLLERGRLRRRRALERDRFVLLLGLGRHRAEAAAASAARDERPRASTSPSPAVNARPARGRRRASPGARRRSGCSDGRAGRSGPESCKCARATSTAAAL